MAIIKPLCLAAALFSSLSIAHQTEKSLKHYLQSSEGTKLFTSSGKTPIVEGFGYYATLFDLLGFSFSYGISLDAILGYEAPLFYYSSGGNNVMFLPSFYAEGSSRNYIEIGYPADYSIKLNLDFIGIKYTFLEPMYRQSIDNLK